MCNQLIMFFKINKNVVAVLMACSVILTSCSKNDEKPLDTESPEVNFQNIQEDAKVRGNVVLDLAATDNSGVTKVEIYIDNVLFATLTEAPYNVNWITKDFPDGKYAIKAIAYDKDGNVKESIINVNVLNRLLKVVVPERNLNTKNEFETFTGWIFLSDSKGKTLGVKKYINGEVFEFATPDDFTEDKVFVNLVRINYNEQPDYKFTSSSIQTRQIAVSEEIILSFSNPISSRTLIGNSKINLINVPDVNSRNYLMTYDGGGGLTRHSSSENSINLDVDLYKSPMNALLSVTDRIVEGRTGQYKFFANFKKDEVINVDYKDLTPMTGTFNISTPGGDSFRYLTANLVAGDNTTNHFLDFSFYESHSIFYPENIFAEFHSYISFSSNGKQNSFYKIGEVLKSVNPLKVNSTILYTDYDNYNFTNTGDYDASSLSFSSSSKSQTDPTHTQNFQWTIISPMKSSVTGSLPLVPSEILKENSFMKRENLVAFHLSFTDYIGVTYDEYFNAIDKGQFSSINKGYNSISERISPTNGRSVPMPKIDIKQINEIINQPYGL